MKFNKIFIIVTITIFTILLLRNSEIKVYALENKVEKVYCDATISDSFADDRILLVLNNEASLSPKTYDELDFSDYGCEKVTELNNVDAYKKRNFVSNDINKVLCLTLNNNSKDNVLSVIEDLIEREDVLYAGPDYVIKCSDNYIEDLENYTGAQHWEIDVLNLQEALNIHPGSEEVIVGVIDSGIDGTHPDLQDSIITNLCVDYTSEEEIIGNPIDPDEHGTHVAGIISAIGNKRLNNSYKNKVSLVSLRVLDETGKGYASSVAKAIQFAEENNIKLLNLSLGWEQSGPNAIYFDYALDTVINAYSGLIIAAAGNDNKNNDGNNPFYPASYSCDNIISVGSHDDLMKKSSNSNYGENSVDIYAPGHFIYSTRSGGGYIFNSGTSMAAPYVTCAASLLLSINPTLTIEDLKNSILNSAEDMVIEVPDTSVNANTGDTLYQNVKRLNIFNCVKYVLNNYSSSITLNNNSFSSVETINSLSSFFNEKNCFKKITINSPSYFIFNISSSYPLEVMLYDSNLNIISLSQMSGCSNILKKYYNYLLDGTYYLRIKFVDEYNIGEVNINLQPHQHSYTASYFWLNSRNHSAKCSCGEAQIKGHAVISGTKTCILCGGNAEIGFNPLGINTSSVIYVTRNGSYILPNGITVLVSEDIEDFLKNTLIFYSKNQNVVTH